MTISTPTERPPYNPSRIVAVHAWFTLGTLILVVAAVVVEVSIEAFMRSPEVLGQRSLGTILLITLIPMLTGITGAIVTLVWLFVKRLVSGRAEAQGRVRTLSIVLLVASFILGLLSLLFLVFAIPRLMEILKDFEIQLPGVTMCYIVLSNLITNPINAIIVLFSLTVVAMLLILKEFLFKDKVAAYLLNAFVTLCLLVWLVFAYMAALLPFLPVKVYYTPN